MFSLSKQRSPKNAANTIILSAMGSRNLPSSVISPYFRANLPSRWSVIAAARKSSAARSLATSRVPPQPGISGRSKKKKNSGISISRSTVSRFGRFNCFKNRMPFTASFPFRNGEQTRRAAQRCGALSLQNLLYSADRGQTTGSLGRGPSRTAVLAAARRSAVTLIRSPRRADRNPCSPSRAP